MACRRINPLLPCERIRSGLSLHGGWLGSRDLDLRVGRVCPGCRKICRRVGEGQCRNPLRFGISAWILADKNSRTLELKNDARRFVLLECPQKSKSWSFRLRFQLLNDPLDCCLRIRRCSNRTADDEVVCTCLDRL